MIKKKKNCCDVMSSIICLTVIATLSVTAAAAAVAYMLHDRCCRSKSFEPDPDQWEDELFPLIPDDEEFEI